MAPRARDYQPGEQVPGTVYVVMRLLGVGGMGTVYDVEDTTIGKRYVLKTLHPQLGAREDLARRMQNEARTLARLNHTNIVEVITAGVTGDDQKLPYYVMERLNGQSLRLVLEKKGQLELAHAYHIGIDLLDALDHAHDKGVIHRDVKPDNIFLHRTSAGVTVTKLLDFGILSLLDATQHETAGRFLGTLRYAAPEQLRGEKPTPKVDVYAAGLVLYELIAGRGPFDDEGDQHKVAAAHIHKPAPPLSHFVVIPRELDALLAAALAKLPGQRPRDAFSFAASLRNLKKALGPAPKDNSTENRATAAALGGVESAANPIVRVHSPAQAEGPYIISPAPAGTPPGSQPVAAPYSTMRDMPTPSLGPSLAKPAGDLARTATSPQPVAVDRSAPTNSFVPDALPSPQHDTNAVMAGFDSTLASNVANPAPPIQPSAFRWPPEQPPARSEEPQVRTLSGLPAGPKSSAGPVLAAVALMILLALASVTLVVVRMRGPSPEAATKRSTVATGTAAPPPSPQPVVVMPAPTLAPQSPDDTPAPSTAPVASASSAPLRVTPRPTLPTVPSVPTAKPVATVAIPARPGPGF
ncbi:MAG TPA: protein kinase [Polyangiaceae bacterium]|jgi:serine/threonine protein kinase